MRISRLIVCEPKCSDFLSLEMTGIKLATASKTSFHFNFCNTKVLPFNRFLLFPKMQMHFRKPFCYASCVWSLKRKNKRKVFQTCFENEQKRSFSTKTFFNSKLRQNRQQSAIFVWSHKRKNKHQMKF